MTEVALIAFPRMHMKYDVMYVRNVIYMRISPFNVITNMARPKTNEHNNKRFST